MFEGFFQPMHLLLLGGVAVIFLALAVLRPIKRAPPGAPAPRDRSVEDRLAHLARLREQNLVSEDEYRKKRQQLLDEI